SALGHATLEECPVGDACRDPTTWSAALETHFAMLATRCRTISTTTRRNARNNWRVLFRAAAAHGLLAAPLPPRLLSRPRRRSFESQQRQNAPHQTNYRLQNRPRPFG